MRLRRWLLSAGAAAGYFWMVDRSVNETAAGVTGGDQHSAARDAFGWHG